MKGITGVVLLLVVLGLAAWYFVASSDTAPPPAMTEAEIAQIEAEIDSLTNEWWEAWETFDWDRGLSLIHDAPQTTWTGAVQTVYSVSEMREVWPPAMVGLGSQEFEFTNSRNVVLASDIVWTLREADYVLMDTAGAVVAEGQMNETAVWLKRDGEWKLLLGHDDDTTLPNEAGQED